MFRILVVEDNANTRKLMAAVLEQHGYETVWPRTGSRRSRFWTKSTSI